MGWTIQELGRYGNTLEQAKRQHVADATRYGDGIKAEMIAYEWKAKTFFAIIRLSSDTNPKYIKPKTWLRVDLIEQSPSEFGYKDGSEEMGMYCENKPSREFAALIYKHIPIATGYAIEFRQRMGIKFDTPRLFDEEPKQIGACLT